MEIGDEPDLRDCVTNEDVRNTASIPEHKGGTADAHNLLQRLRKLETEDPIWIVRCQTDSQGRLTHLFWMSPDQRERVVDVGQVRASLLLLFIFSFLYFFHSSLLLSLIILFCILACLRTSVSLCIYRHPRQILTKPIVWAAARLVYCPKQVCYFLLL